MANGIDIDVGQSLLVGPQGPQGEIGPRGYGIKTIAKTGTDGLVDTYTVTFDDDRTATFEVTNGRAISSIDLTSTVENVDTYTITYNDGTTSTFTVTNSNVSREEFEEAVEVINSEMDTKEAEGEDVNLTGVAKTNLDITVQGNTYQETTTGKNKLLLPNQTITHMGVTMTTYEDGRFVIDGAATGIVNTVGFVLPNPIAYTSNKQYTFSLTYVSGSATNLTGATTINLKKGVVGESSYGDFISISNIQNDYAQNFSKSITTADENSVTRLQFISYLSDQVFNNLTYKLQLEESSEATDFEPYTNGASPNPDYPQEIQVVTGENEVQIQGKNLANFPTNADAASTGDVILIDFGEDKKINEMVISLVVNNLIFTNPSTNGAILDFRKADGTHQYRTPGNFRDSEGQRMTSGQRSVNTGVYFANERNITFRRLLYMNLNHALQGTISIQAEYGLVPTKFEPYVDANYPLSLSSLELAKIGNYKDYIYKNDTNWFIHRVVKKASLNFTREPEILSDRTWFWFNKPSRSMDINNYSTNAITEVAQSVSEFSSKDIAFTGNGAKAFYGISYKNTYENIPTLTELQEKVNGKSYYYGLDTPTEEQITDTTLIQQLEALSKATTNAHDLMITTETENLKPVLKVQYKESNLVKIEDLEKRIKELEDRINT